MIQTLTRYIIETDRLGLRELTDDDLENLTTVLSDPITMRHFTSAKNREQIREWVERSMESYKKNGFGLWAVIKKANDQFIGDCGITLQNIAGQLQPGMGYHLHKEEWGRGYATEAAKACRDYAFKKLNLPEIFSYMRVENIASSRVAENIGMKLRKKFINKGHPTLVYSIKQKE